MSDTPIPEPDPTTDVPAVAEEPVPEPLVPEPTAPEAKGPRVGQACTYTWEGPNGPATLAGVVSAVLDDEGAGVRLEVTWETGVTSGPIDASRVEVTETA